MRDDDASWWQASFGRWMWRAVTTVVTVLFAVVCVATAATRWWSVAAGRVSVVPYPTASDRWPAVSAWDFNIEGAAPFLPREPPMLKREFALAVHGSTLSLVRIEGLAAPPLSTAGVDPEYPPPRWYWNALRQRYTMLPEPRYSGFDWKEQRPMAPTTPAAARSAIQMPLWIVLVVLGMQPAVAGVGAYRNRRSKRWAAAGRCPACGYDLRESPGRCSECGHVRQTV